MAITTLNGVIAGFQAPQFFAKQAPAPAAAGKPVSYWPVAGIPGVGLYPNGSVGGGTYSSTGGLVAGQIPHTDPVSGNSYLGRFQSQAGSAPGLLMLADRLWDYSGFTITQNTAQTVNSVAWPARDNTGSTSGAGVLLGVEISATVGAATPTITVAYTNSATTGSRSATNLDATVSAAATGSFYRIGLQAGDVGVQSVQTLTLSVSWVSGTMVLVAYRVLAMLEISAAGYSNAIDALTSGMPQLFNGTVPFLIYTPSTAAASAIVGQYIETQG